MEGRGRLAIIGLGLIGGSLGMALRRVGGWEVVGYSRSKQTRSLAVKLGAVDRAVDTLEEAASGVTVVILAVPILAMEPILAQLGRLLLPGTLVSDVASTKAQVMAWAQASLPPQVPFIGGHPMAGKEVYGIEAAEDDLFLGCVYCLVPGPSASPQAVEQMLSLAEAIGARPLILEASRHDELVAGISHLPLVASCALMSLAARSTLWPEMAPLAASGFRGATRLASGSPEMSGDICITNREALLSWLDGYIQELRAYAGLIQGGGEALRAAFLRAKEAREAWQEGKRKGG